MVLHVIFTFYTRDARFAVPSHPINILRDCTITNLQNVLRDLLQGDDKKLSFDFLIQNEFIEGTLDEFLTKKKIVAEVVEIEYTIRQNAPEATEEIKQDDFISCIRRMGSYILTSCYDGTVQLQTVDNSEPIFTLMLEEQPKVVEWVNVGASDSDNSVFLTGGFGQVVRLWVWNPTKKSVNCVAACRGHKETILSLASSNQVSGCTAELFASASFDFTIKVWSADSNETDLSEETGGISHKRKSEDKVPIRIPRVTLAGHRNMVSRVCWLGDDQHGSTAFPKLISCGWDQSIRVWDVSSSSGTSGETQVAGKCGETRCIVVGSPLHDLSVASQGILVGASDNKVRIYDLRAKDALAQIGFQGHNGWLTSVAWAPHRSDQFVTGSVDKAVKLWDTRRIAAPLYDLMGHRDMVTSVDWAPSTIDGRHFILSASADGTAKVYHYPT